MKIYTLDSTLRDGMQAEKISFSVNDKLNIVKLLDKLGVDYIEAGNPASNIKDEDFFIKAKELNLTHSKLAAFGSTCKPNLEPDKDKSVRKLLECGTDIVVIFGKAWDFHVTNILKTTLEENIRMIYDTINYFIKNKKEVIFDAEHFFDGYKSNKEYALKVLMTAQNAGAHTLTLCDTNGGSFPNEISDITLDVINKVNSIVGIHTHNDSGMAVANSILSVKNGAKHVQGTINGIGERCGNANLSTIIANMQLKDNYELIPSSNLSKLTEICRAIAEISNISISNMPYVSKSAFSHKSGMHIDAVIKSPISFEHIDPSLLGNKRDFLISEMSGKSAIINIVKSIDPTIEKNSEKTQVVLEQLKKLEFEGYQFEVATASLELAIRRILGIYKPYFHISKLQLITEHEEDSCSKSSVLIKVDVDDKEEITAVEADGPVQAMDMAIRKALNVFYPIIEKTHLTDYKVRVLDSQSAAGARVRVLIETSDETETWTTIGVSIDIIEASKIALLDAISYKLLKSGE